MSTPTDQFAGLSVQDMAPTSDEAKIRAIELQDILSVWDVTNFPSEFQLPIFDHIDRSPGARPPSHQWTDLTNQQGTFFTWGCWDDKGWEFLSRLTTPKARATAFTEKLERRFKECFNNYQRLSETPLDADELKSGIADIVHRILSIFQAIYADQNTFRIEEAETREADTLRIALEALQTICTLAMPITPNVSAAGGPARRTRARAPSVSDPNLSLFGALIKAPADGEGSLLFGTLEQFTGAALSEHKELLVSISGQLDKLGNTPADHIERFDMLQEKADDESAVPKIKAGPSGRKRGLEADPRSGSSIEATPKRGKRTGGR